MATATTFLTKEFARAKKRDENDTFYGLMNDNLFHWVVTTIPTRGVFRELMIKMHIEFGREYPNKPPVVKVVSPGFQHPNVYPDGKVCLSLLHEPVFDPFNPEEQMSEKWKPTCDTYTIIQAIKLLLDEPNFDSPANMDASVAWKEDPKTFKCKVRKAMSSN